MSNLYIDDSDEVGPTRILSPTPSASEESDTSISATRPPRVRPAASSEDTGFSRPAPAPSKPVEPEPERTTPLGTSLPHRVAERTTIPIPNGNPVGNLSSYRENLATPARTMVDKNYSRIQFLPAALGWLVTFALTCFASPAHSALVELLALPGYTKPVFQSFPEAFSDVVYASNTTVGLWIWIISAALFYFACFALGGYAAARMSVLAPIKQAVGLWLWHILALMAATAAVGATGYSNTTIDHLALHNLLDESSTASLAGFLLLLLLALLGALAGSLFGPVYHRRLKSPQANRHIRENNQKPTAGN